MFFFRSATVSIWSLRSAKCSLRSETTRSGGRDGGSFIRSRYRERLCELASPVPASWDREMKALGASIATLGDSPGTLRTPPTTRKEVFPRRTESPGWTPNCFMRVGSITTAAWPSFNPRAAFAGSQTKSP